MGKPQTTPVFCCMLAQTGTLATPVHVCQLRLHTTCIPFIDMHLHQGECGAGAVCVASSPWRQMTCQAVWRQGSLPATIASRYQAKRLWHVPIGTIFI